MSFIDQILAARLFGGNSRGTTPPINPSPNVNTIPDGGYNAGNLLPTGGVRPQVDVGLMGQARSTSTRPQPWEYYDINKPGEIQPQSYLGAVNEKIREATAKTKWTTGLIDWTKNKKIRQVIADDPIIGRIIRRESAGKPGAESPKGAKGLMQLMPNTYGKKWDSQLNDYRYGYGMYGKHLTDEEVWSPEKNVKFGTQYFKELRKRFGSDRQALIAYNWGPGRYKQWKAAGGDESKLPKETRDYLDYIVGSNENYPVKGIESRKKAHNLW